METNKLTASYPVSLLTRELETTLNGIKMFATTLQSLIISH